MDDKYVVAINLGGISNRLKCLVSLWRIGVLTKRKLLIYWPRNSVCGANFSDLFENNFQEISREKLFRLKKKEYKFHDPNDISIENPQKKYLVSDTWRWAFLREEKITKLIARDKIENYPIYESRTAPTQDYKGIDFAFNKINPNIKKEIWRYLKKIKPIEKIREKVSEFEEKNSIRDCIGVHIRQGDYLAGKDRLGFVSREEEFINRINELIEVNPKERFFLCTDSEEVQERFKELFKERVVIFSKTNFDREGVVFTQEGLIDLLLLSKTKRILGTYGSTFTEMAWWLGNCKPKIEIMIDKENLDAYLKNFKKRGRGAYERTKRLIAILTGRAPKFR